MLTPDLAARLLKDAPRELDRLALEQREDFLFGARDLREQFGREWGGEVRAIINMNFVLHFVPRFTDEMRGPGELPEFAVMPDDARAGQDERRRIEGVKDLEAFDAVTFWVAKKDYDAMVAELVAVFARLGDHPRLPDTLFAGQKFVKLIAGRVLEHGVVRDQRRFDFTKRTF